MHVSAQMFESHAALIESDMSQFWVRNEVGNSTVNLQQKFNKKYKQCCIFHVIFGVAEPVVQMSCQEEYKNISKSVLRKFNCVKDTLSNQTRIIAVFLN